MLKTFIIVTPIVCPRTRGVFRMPSQRVHLPTVQGPPGQHQVPRLGEDAGEAPLHVQVCRPWLSGNLIVTTSTTQTQLKPQQI